MNDNAVAVLSENGSKLRFRYDRDVKSMESVIIVIHLLVVAALVVVVLLQRSEGGALGIGGGGGGGGGGFLTGRGAANLLTRTTAILAACFFATSLILTILARVSDKPSDVLDNVPAQTETQSGEGQPAAGGNGILDELQQRSQSGPQVPTSQ
ncbi:protein translocase subunit secG [Cohaesibacter gelatinilyticus]|uniref:Protein-export membrane protein SecG n=2 Tax=Cohaesibacter gelatinilyticus TaxID=372072 RepID=A0A285NED3_9HYPH|nr:protein translocase subunit secG [Cohaesibacter gelatinilyticus]